MKLSDYCNVLTVKALKKLLNNYNDDLFVGFTGHFGEFYPLESCDIHVSVADYDFYIKNKCKRISNFSILELNIPAIGEEPE